ncbi:hypothetical protein [Methylobacterium haplocladii]|nr:hypothetical protein [Methylobacterium haplocladii]
MSLDQVAADRHLTLAEAAELAEREHWPKVFRLHQTLVLVPAARG